ncbi:cytosolic sulfotransferase 1-like [Mercenaria mercenaria]|uniref:cytosolic sulfotransferase 1-like n=1 Tax=Mercenaria mercenaria TaxID=6596 RepID=UPI00234E4CEB|nr:cytosolic sulfotransferase 1-like [Mercenaria mercenaria]
MDLINSPQTLDIIVTGYKHSGVDHLHKTINQLTAYRSPVTSDNHTPNITCCQGYLPSQYPRLHINPSSKIVFIVRNPKDTAVAMYKSSGVESSTEFSEFLYSFIFGESDEKWSDHTRQWENVLSQHSTSNLHLVYFDDLIQNFEHEVSRLCKFFDIQKSSIQISEMCSLLRKEAEQPQPKRRKTEHSVNGHRETFYDTGMWKNQFTVNLQEQFDSAILDILKDSKLDLHKLLG